MDTEIPQPSSSTPGTGAAYAGTWRDRWTARRIAAVVGFGFVYVLVYVALDRVSYVYPVLALNITPWNPPAALAVGLLFVRGLRWFPLAYLAIVVADLAVRVPPPTVPVGLALPLIQACGWGAITVALQGPLALAPGLPRQADLLRLIVASTVGAAVIGALAVATLALGAVIPAGDFVDVFVRYWVGDTLGLVVMLPLVLMLVHPPRRRELWRIVRTPEFAAQVAVILAIVGYVFDRRSVEAFQYFYLLFVPLIWIAVRQRFAGAVLAVALVQVGLVVAVVAAGYRALTVVEIQALMLCLALTGLFLGMAVDQERTATERLDRTRRLSAAGETSTALAHELNQPLAALANYADSIRLQLDGTPPDSDAARATAVHLRRMSTRASAIVRRFRDLGSSPSAVAPYEISVPIQSALASLRERADREGVRMTVRVPARCPIVRMDRDRISLVFENLITNAIDAAVANPAATREVTVVVRSEARGIVHVAVEDSGTGIALESTERIFEPFRTSKTGGMGLGLPISRSIIEAHGGAIWARAARHGIIELWIPK